METLAQMDCEAKRLLDEMAEPVLREQERFIGRTECPEGDKHLNLMSHASAMEVLLARVKRLTSERDEALRQLRAVKDALVKEGG